MMLWTIDATLNALMLHRSVAPILHTFESLNMSMIQIFYVALFIVFFSFLRFGVPALLLWALGRLATRHGLQEPRVPISR